MNNYTLRQYTYVGPEEIRAAVAPCGQVIRTQEDLVRVLSDREGDTFTFVIGLQGFLSLADRHAEHVACAGGEDVLSAGEIIFGSDLDNLSVENVTNQSTGYCPEPDSWPVVAAALDKLGVEHPGFTREFQFRRCPKCGQTNLIKDEHYVCDVCHSDLPLHWIPNQSRTGRYPASFWWENVDRLSEPANSTT